MSEMRQIKNCLDFLLSRIGIHQIFRICDPEYLNSKTYCWILIKISEHVRNAPNYKLLDFFAYADYGESGTCIRKIFRIINPECPNSKIAGRFWWKFQVISEMDQITKLLLCFAFLGQYPENIPDK